MYPSFFPLRLKRPWYPGPSSFQVARIQRLASTSLVKIFSRRNHFGNLHVMVGLRSLNLGICPKLNGLKIEAPSMVLLELKGCGVISEAFINCLFLTSLDASFCSQLKDNCLFATTASCPLIESLILMSCPSIGSDGLLSLRRLKNLTSLDLSYTFLTKLQPVFASCPQLKVLKLQACKYLTDTALEPLYKDATLPTLRELDLS
ncbi:putative F-box/LRR-repeat protein [Helianthus debilis subsp. tardiflorus]